MPAHHPFYSGRGLPGYRLGSIIGTGAAGTVIAAVRICNGIPVAVKRICLDGRPSKDLATALLEANILRQLPHPNIVKLVEAVAQDTQIWLVLEQADRGDLGNVIRAGGLNSEEQAVTGFVQLALAIWHLHKRGILHRDIKPHNILVYKGALLKLCDFGAACIVDKANTEHGPVVGTTSYLAPEILKGQPHSEKSDVWALGCVLYEMIALQPAYSGATPFAAIHNIMAGHRHPISKNCSQGLRCLIDDLLQPDPELRPSIRQVLASPFLFQYIQTYISRLHQQGEDTTVLGLHDLNLCQQNSNHSTLAGHVKAALCATFAPASMPLACQVSAHTTAMPAVKHVGPATSALRSSACHRAANSKQIALKRVFSPTMLADPAQPEAAEMFEQTSTGRCCLTADAADNSKTKRTSHPSNPSAGAARVAARIYDEHPSSHSGYVAAHTATAPREMSSRPATMMLSGAASAARAASSKPANTSQGVGQDIRAFVQPRATGKRDPMAKRDDAKRDDALQSRAAMQTYPTTPSTVGPSDHNGDTVGLQQCTHSSATCGSSYTGTKQLHAMTQLSRAYAMMPEVDPGSAAGAFATWQPASVQAAADVCTIAACASQHSDASRTGNRGHAMIPPTTPTPAACERSNPMYDRTHAWAMSATAQGSWPLTIPPTQTHAMAYPDRAVAKLQANAAAASRADIIKAVRDWDWQCASYLQHKMEPQPPKQCLHTNARVRRMSGTAC